MSDKAAVPTALVGSRSVLVEGLSAVLETSRYWVKHRSGSIHGVRAGLNDRRLELCVLVCLDLEIERILHEVRDLRRDYSALCIVVLSIEASSADRFRAAGADAHLPIDVSPEAFFMVVDFCLADTVAKPPRRDERGSTKALGGKATLDGQAGKPLSARELDVVECVADGGSNKHVAQRLAITEATVKAHIRTILKKTGTSNRTQVAIWARNVPDRRGQGPLQYTRS